MGLASDLPLMILGEYEEWTFKEGDVDFWPIWSTVNAVNRKRGIVVKVGLFFASIRKPDGMSLPLFASFRVCQTLRKMRKEKLLDEFCNN